jgi:hypothetical protein
MCFRAGYRPARCLGNGRSRFPRREQYRNALAAGLLVCCNLAPGVSPSLKHGRLCRVPRPASRPEIIVKYRLWIKGFSGAGDFGEAILRRGSGPSSVGSMRDRCKAGVATWICRTRRRFTWSPQRRRALRDAEMGHEVAVGRSAPVLEGVRSPMDVSSPQPRTCRLPPTHRPRLDETVSFDDDQSLRYQSHPEVTQLGQRSEATSRPAGVTSARAI